MLLENRNKNLTNLHKTADYLSRSLRENYKIFTVDSAAGIVQFLSENNNLLTCKYEIKDSSVVLENIKTDTVENYLSPERIDGIVNEGISQFISNLRENRFDKADTSFTDVLNLFEDRNDLDTLRYKFEKHSSSFDNSTQIVESSEYKKLTEGKEALKAFIAENKEEILKNQDLQDCAGIVNAMSTVFETKSDITLDNITESGKIEIDLKEGNTLYEMVCKQELMRQELMESKENFSGAWATNKAIQDLASCIFSDDKNLIESIEKVIEEVPYFCFATKADLNETLTSIYEVNTTDTILKKDIKEFVSKIYETKKPVKEELVSLLSEKYGVNVANLKFVPTFSNLSKTHSVFFEVLSMCMEEGILQDVTKDFSKFVGSKGGVEALEVNDLIKECINSDSENLNENAILMNYIDVPKLTSDLSQVIDVLGAMTGAGAQEEEMPEEEMEDEASEEMPEEEAVEEVPEEEVPEEEAAEEEEMAGDAEEEQEAEAEGSEVVGDDSDSSVGLEKDKGNVGSIMADLDKILSTLGGGDEGDDEDERMPDDQYGA